MRKQIVIARNSPHQLGYVIVSVIIGPKDAEVARNVRALIDTGADTTVIRAKILSDLGIPLTGTRRTFQGAGASGTVGSAWVDLGFTGATSENGFATLRNRKEIGVADNLSEEMILGMDVLGCFDLSFSRTGAITLDWSSF